MFRIFFFFLQFCFHSCWWTTWEGRLSSLRPRVDFLQIIECNCPASVVEPLVLVKIKALLITYSHKWNVTMGRYIYFGRRYNCQPLYLWVRDQMRGGQSVFATSFILLDWLFAKPYPSWLLLLGLSSFCTHHVKYRILNYVSNTSNFWKICQQYQREVDRSFFCRQSYIHNIICQQSTVNDETIEMELKAHHSKCNMHRTSRQFTQRTKL